MKPTFDEAALWLTVLAFIATLLVACAVVIGREVFDKWRERRDFRRQLDGFGAGRQG